MAPPTPLLTLPPEIRHQIYSYMLLNDCIIDMIAANVTRPQERGLFLTCRQLHFEAFDYYYSTNTFQLSLCDPTYSPDQFLNGNLILTNRLRSMRNLHVEIGPMQTGPVTRGFVAATGETGTGEVLRHQEKLRWRRFVQQLTDTNEGQVGSLLKTLVVMTRHACARVPTFAHFPIALSVSEEKLMALTQLVEPLKDRFGKITIEIRSGYVWTPMVPIGDYPYEVLVSAAVPPH